MEPDYVYGVGNEVLLAVTFIAGVLVPVIAYLSLNSRLYSYVVRFLRQYRLYSYVVRFVRQYILRQNANNEGAAQPMRDHVENVDADGNPTQEHVVHHSNYNSGSCPICLSEQQLAVETNCGHVFCGNCLRSCIYGNGLMSRIQCPMCRQGVTMLFECFTYEERYAAPDSPIAIEAPNVSRMVEDYNQRYAHGNRTILDMVRDWPTLMRHLCNEFFSLGGLMIMFRIRIVLCFLAAIMYVFSPLDILPEAVFGVLGLLDDVFVVFLLAIYVSIIYRRLVASRSMGT